MKKVKSFISLALSAMMLTSFATVASAALTKEDNKYMYTPKVVLVNTEDDTTSVPESFSAGDTVAIEVYLSDVDGDDVVIDKNNASNLILQVLYPPTLTNFTAEDKENIYDHITANYGYIDGDFSFDQDSNDAYITDQIIVKKKTTGFNSDEYVASYQFKLSDTVEPGTYTIKMGSSTIQSGATQKVPQLKTVDIVIKGDGNKVQAITGDDSAYAGKSLHISPEMTFVNEAGSTKKIYLYKKGVADAKTYDAAETFAAQGIEVGSGASVQFNIAVISTDTAADTFTFEIK